MSLEKNPAKMDNLFEKFIECTNKDINVEWNDYKVQYEGIRIGLSDLLESETPLDLEVGLKISNSIIVYYDRAVGITNTSYIELLPYHDNKIVRNKKKLNRRNLDSDQRYWLLSIFIYNTAFRFYIYNSEKKNDIENWEAHNKIIKNIFSNLLCELKYLYLGNKKEHYNQLFKILNDLLKNSKDTYSISYLNYLLLWASMKVNWFSGVEKIKKSISRIFSIDWNDFRTGLFNIGTSVLRFLLWITSGFGDKPIRYFASLITINSIFGYLYCINGCIEIGKCRNQVDTFLNGFYFSVVTFATLGYGDLYPTNDFGKMLVILEVIIGYVMLALLIHLLIKRLRI